MAGPIRSYGNGATCSTRIKVISRMPATALLGRLQDGIDGEGWGVI